MASRPYNKGTVVFDLAPVQPAMCKRCKKNLVGGECLSNNNRPLVTCESCRTKKREWSQRRWAKNDEVIGTQRLKNRLWSQNNSERHLENIKRWARENPEKVRSYRFRAQYGISFDECLELLNRQGNCCAICQKTIAFDGTSMAANVDHCHETGGVRGILCGKCNNGLGRFSDDINVLRRAVDYLENNVC